MAVNTLFIMYSFTLTLLQFAYIFFSHKQIHTFSFLTNKSIHMSLEGLSFLNTLKCIYSNIHTCIPNRMDSQTLLSAEPRQLKISGATSSKKFVISIINNHMQVNKIVFCCSSVLFRLFLF